MNSKPSAVLYPWSKDLEASRDVHPRQRDGFAMVLGWFETFRSRQRLVAGREACVLFWRDQVKSKERPGWQLEQWAAAIRRYWLRVAGASANWRRPTLGVKWAGPAVRPYRVAGTVHAGGGGPSGVRRRPRRRPRRRSLGACLKSVLR